MDNHQLLWLIFAVIVGGAVAVDLSLKSHRHRTHAVSFGESLRWTLIWVSLAVSFCAIVWMLAGKQRALEFLTAYLVEESLSVDNMFVFVMIFRFFAIPEPYQPRVLKWGIFGAVVMRFLLIFTGVALLQRFHWLLYVFGAVLIYTAFKLLSQGEEDAHPDRNWALRTFRRVFPVSEQLHGEHFFAHENGRRVATRLLTTLVVVEASDLMFAMDSIPAVLAISKDPFIIFSSNVFAILGLRALYFMVSGLMNLFRYLRFGLAVILFFIGAKMLLTHYFHMPIYVSLAVIASCLGISIAASLLIKRGA